MKSKLSALTLAFTICGALSYVHCVGVFGADSDEAADSEDSLRRKKRDAGAGQGGAVDSAAPTSSPGGTTTNCWPYDRPSMATLRASKHKVFAHYFAPFPISIDNEPPAQDYYEKNYLNPHGEGDKFLGQGGFLRERPVPQNPWPSGVDIVEKNMEIEVRRAAAIGLDGFAFDVLDPNAGSELRGVLDALYTAAQTVDPDFRIMLVMDMTSSTFAESDATSIGAIVDMLSSYGSNPLTLHNDDNRIVFSAFGAELRPVSFWKTALTRIANSGLDVAFMPMSIGDWVGNFDGLGMWGVATWGTRTFAGAAELETSPAQPHAQGLVWMSPVAPQDSRPKDLVFTEASNSRAFRAQWEATIRGNADWVQLITWNDYSEDSEIAPSSKTRNAFYDLSGYYTTWFKTGVQPPIVRDAVYYFHRAHSLDPSFAPPNLGMQDHVFEPMEGTPAVNEIEVVGFLTAPGTLEIAVGGQVHKKDVGAGIQSFTIPLEEGTPTFRVTRGGATVAEVVSATPINDSIAYQDPLYHAGASLTCSVQ